MMRRSQDSTRTAGSTVVRQDNEYKIQDSTRTAGRTGRPRPTTVPKCRLAKQAKEAQAGNCTEMWAGHAREAQAGNCTDMSLLLLLHFLAFH